ncbi:hypothetical protein WJX84_004660 [Apatococcus fuscideae]|uniref:Uncharacterized protein n=1 Tax=Apatococcus fuscideae TaxID=2026836 RepID=A0AAW1TGB4_9CHLO
MDIQSSSPTSSSQGEATPWRKKKSGAVLAAGLKDRKSRLSGESNCRKAPRIPLADSHEADDDFAALNFMPKLPARLSSSGIRSSPAPSSLAKGADPLSSADLDALEQLPTRHIPFLKSRTHPSVPALAGRPEARSANDRQPWNDDSCGQDSHQDCSSQPGYASPASPAFDVAGPVLDGPDSPAEQEPPSGDVAHQTSRRKKRARAPLQRLYEPADEELGDEDDPWMSASQREAKRKQVAEEKEDAELLQGVQPSIAPRPLPSDLTFEGLSAWVQASGSAPGRASSQAASKQSVQERAPHPLQKQPAGNKQKSRSANPFVSARSALMQGQGSKVQHPRAAHPPSRAPQQVSMDTVRSLLQRTEPEEIEALGIDPPRRNGQYRQPRPMPGPERAPAAQKSSRLNQSSSRYASDTHASGAAHLDPMSDGVEVLEVDDEDDFGREGSFMPSQRPQSNHPSSHQAQRGPVPAEEADVIDLDASEDRPSSICASGSEQQGLAGPPWWHRFAHFAPLAAHQNGRDPRNGTLLHVNFVEQFSSTPAAEQENCDGYGDHAGPSRPARGRSRGGSTSGRGRRKAASKKRRAARSNGPTAEKGRWVTEHDASGSVKVYVTPDGMKHVGQAAFRQANHASKLGKIKKPRSSKPRKGHRK